MNRELAIQLAKHPKVSVSFFVPKCCDEDKRVASNHNVTILEAKRRPGYEPADWLAFPPKDHDIDFVIGHGVILGRQAQIIRDYHHCKWMQVVHTAPEQIAAHKNYSGSIEKGEQKQLTEIELCEMADVVVAVGPKLKEIYSAYLRWCGKDVFELTPGIFAELSNLILSVQSDKSTTFRVLLFGRGDSEDFELKGFDIAAQAVAKLNDRSYVLLFVGAYGLDEVAEKFKNLGLSPDQLTVRSYLESREDLAKVLCAVNLSIIPSRSEGFGLTALEALSAGLPFLVSQNSGFGDAIQDIGSSFIVDSEDPETWAEAIKGVQQKGSEAALQECQELRERYADKYSWETQCNDLVEMMQNVVYDQPSSDPLELCAVNDKGNSAPVSATTPYDQQGARPTEKSSSSIEPASSRNRGDNSKGLVKSVSYVADLWQSWQSWFLGRDPDREPEMKMTVEQSVLKPRKIHLFNCDRTCKLDAVEDWLNATKPKLRVQFSVEKHYFSLAEMSELSSKTIPGLRMDLAIFAFRLSINEENAGIGYAKIYRALLQATGECCFTLRMQLHKEDKILSWEKDRCIGIL